MAQETIENLLITYNRTKELISRNTKLLDLCETELETQNLKQLIRSFELSSDLLEQHLILRFTPAIKCLQTQKHSEFSVGLLEFHYDMRQDLKMFVETSIKLLDANNNAEYSDAIYYLQSLSNQNGANESTARASKE